MARKRLYSRGEQIPNLHNAISEMEAGRYVFLRDRPCHPSWLMNMSVWTLRRLVAGGQLYYAVDSGMRTEKAS